MSVLATILIGVLVGIITGITPGVHVNLVCTLLLASFPFLPLTGVETVAFIVAVATTHTFLDIIPSVFLGAPDSATALGVLPGHRYLLRGQGMMAVKLSTIGALGGLILGLLAFPLFMEGTQYLERVPLVFWGWILLAVPVIMLLREEKRFAALCIVATASLFGWLGFSYPDPLFPMLSGLFGASGMLYSLSETSTLPEQQYLPYTAIRVFDIVRALLGGLLAGGLTAILPGLGAAHAAVIGMLLAKGTGDHGFLALTGTIGTTNFFLGLAAYASVEKARNGALVAATTIEPHFPMLVAIASALIAGGIGVVLTLTVGKRTAKLITKLPYRALSLSVLVFVTSLVVLLTGLTGLLLYIVGTAIGLLAASSKAARAHAMSCILVPVGLRFLGF